MEGGSAYISREVTGARGAARVARLTLQEMRTLRRGEVRTLFIDRILGFGEALTMAMCGRSRMGCAACIESNRVIGALCVRAIVNWSLEQMREIARERGGKCLSTVLSEWTHSASLGVQSSPSMDEHGRRT